ncbi:TIGR02453 family protein [Maribellus comscasis]|uniref:TIGR02453 family protein n=1 Tax=Maribellus comscasis TaxID=2681766 RepID=A0A6I6K3F4_9BACT|nr:DUF2461 domain-containing protein [Maribellus comscasis]QGY44464.1 TIGR02453 family protein [Maribellus comscasis]
MKKILNYLEDLSRNNNREWFNENRGSYEESRDKMLFMTEVLINEIRKFDPEIPMLSPKDCMFRIFRDVRFSNDKRPYKTNFGSFISKGGRKGDWPGYYFHIEPKGSFVGGGVYMPQAEPLRAIRNYVAENAQEFLDIIEDKEFKKIYPEMYDHKLKTAPKGFPKDHKYIGLLKYKSYVFSTNFDTKLLLSDSFVDYIVQSFRVLYPFNDFLNRAVDKNV